MDKRIKDDVQRVTSIISGLLLYLDDKEREEESRAILPAFRLIKDGEETMAKFSDGSFRARGTGWEYRFMLDGKQFSVHGKTRQVCYDKRIEHIKESGRGGTDKPITTREMYALMKQLNAPEGLPRADGQTLGDWLLQWYDTYKVPKLKPNSLAAVERCIRLHIPEKLKIKPLGLLSALDIQQALNNIASTRIRKYTYDVYNEALRKAHALGKTAASVMAAVEPVQHKRKQGQALTLEEQTAFVKAIKGHALELLYLFYLFTGVRRNEALSLCWADIEENRLLIRGTKTETSYRVLPLTAEIKKLLQAQPHDKNNPERVFPYKQDYVTHQFHKICPAHKLHDLRHTFATRCMECGISMKTVQQLLGHSTMSTTSQIYTHVLDDFLRQEAERFTLYPKLTLKNGNEPQNDKADQ